MLRLLSARVRSRVLWLPASAGLRARLLPEKGKQSDLAVRLLAWWYQEHRVGTLHIQFGGRQAQEDGGDVVVAALAV
jgi:hypothetical protein